MSAMSDIEVRVVPTENVPVGKTRWAALATKLAETAPAEDCVTMTQDYAVALLDITEVDANTIVFISENIFLYILFAYFS